MCSLWITAGFLRDYMKMDVTEKASASSSEVNTRGAVSSSSSEVMNGSSHTRTSPPSGEASGVPKGKRRSKYRHVAAYHSKSQHSSLSRESNVPTSFLGFRNLMVIVLGTMFSFWATW